jgi:hypothetical protein
VHPIIRLYWATVCCLPLCQRHQMRWASPSSFCCCTLLKIPLSQYRLEHSAIFYFIYLFFNF